MTSLKLFLLCLQIIFQVEGGWYDGDGGTNYGIRASTLKEANRLGIVQEKEVKKITRIDAAKIYERMYWIPSGANKLPWPLCLVVFDAAVHAGVGKSRSLLNQSYREVMRGEQTKAHDQRQLALRFVIERWIHLKSLSKFPKRPGWRRRMNVILSEVLGVKDVKDRRSRK